MYTCVYGYVCVRVCPWALSPRASASLGSSQQAAFPCLAWFPRSAAQHLLRAAPCSAGRRGRGGAEPQCPEAAALLGETYQFQH